jgi:hypothetical protein
MSPKRLTKHRSIDLRVAAREGDLQVMTLRDSHGLAKTVVGGPLSYRHAPR